MLFVTENTGPSPFQGVWDPHPVLIYGGLPAHQIQAHQSVKTAFLLRDTLKFVRVAATEVNA